MRVNEYCLIGFVVIPVILQVAWVLAALVPPGHLSDELFRVYSAVRTDWAANEWPVPHDNLSPQGTQAVAPVTDALPQDENRAF